MKPVNELTIHFPLSLSLFVKITTGLICSLPVLFLFLYISTADAALLIPFFVIICMILGCWFYAPYAYELGEDSLVIQRYGGRLRIPYSTIDEAEPIPSSWTIRVFGVGGLFGMYGWFYHKPIGMFKAYATRWDRLVLIRFAQKAPVVLSPDNPEAFLLALKTKAGLN